MCVCVCIRTGIQSIDALYRVVRVQLTVATRGEGDTHTHARTHTLTHVYVELSMFNLNIDVPSLFCVVLRGPLALAVF